MSYEYWDTTGWSGSGWGWIPSGSSNTTEAPRTGTGYTTSSTGTTTWTCIVCPPPRKLVVATPEHWTEDDVRAFCYLVNEATATGWRVTMVLHGDLKILDPSIEVRSMKDFVPWLRRAASEKDREVIESFFRQHTLTPEAA